MKMKGRLLSILLGMALALGLMPGMSLTAYADDPYASIKNTTTEITFDGKSWYLINYNDSTVTLLTKECVGESAYNSSGDYYVDYASSTVKTVVDSWYSSNISADAKKAVNDGMFLLTKDQAYSINNENVRKCSQASSGGWWLRVFGSIPFKIKPAFVGAQNGFIYDNSSFNNTYGVRPALKLNLSSVIFSSESREFTLKQTISAENVTATYGDTNRSVSARVTIPATGGGEISYAVKSASEDYIEVNSSTGELKIKRVPSDGKAYVIITAAESGVYGKTTKEVTVTINKADPIANAPTGLTATYGQTLANVTLTNPTGNTPGTWAWVNGAQSVGNVVSPAATFKANFTPTDTTNYSSKTNVDVTVTVGKANAAAATVTANNFTYDGTPQPLVTVTGEAVGGTMYYAVTTENKAPTDASLYTTSIPTATDAGTYYVWYKVVGDDNHLDTEAACVTSMIAPEFGDPDFAMPEDLTAIDESAFEGVTSMTVVDAHTCTAIAQGAFKGTGLEKIRLPKECEISPAAFDQDGLIYVYAPSGGKTETYCAGHDNLVFVAE